MLLKQIGEKFTNVDYLQKNAELIGGIFESVKKSVFNGYI